MKKLILLFAAILMASTGLWAETKNVSYRYPVYNIDGDPASGIKEWKTASVEATVVTDASEPVTWNAGWYVVTGSDVTLSKGAICAGDVRLILADGAKLTATGYWVEDEYMGYAGIQVSGDGNSLTIFGQTAQTGQLEANGADGAAGIGGKMKDAGSNITINGGAITATGDTYAAGIGGGYKGNGSNISINGGTITANGSVGAAGIGGGYKGNGSNITINGGTVTANGDEIASGIGGGGYASCNNIRVATTLQLKAGSDNPPITEINNDGDDLDRKLNGKRYAVIFPLQPIKDAAIAAIDAAFEGVTNENVKYFATTAKTSIEAATSEKTINSIKEKALADLQNIFAIYDAGKTEALGTLGTEQDGPAVEVIRGDKKVILYSPDKVNFIKVQTKE